MILGTGIDLCDTRRIARVLDRFGERFLHRVFTAGERDRAFRRQDPAPVLARRWAAKEATAKALGTGIGRNAGWREIEIVNLPSGRPTLSLTGAAARCLASALPAGHAPNLHVSLTDEPPYAQAIVVIEALPQGAP